MHTTRKCLTQAWTGMAFISNGVVGSDPPNPLQYQYEPRSVDEPGTDPTVAPFDGGFTWIANPAEGMQRASHALATDTGGWLVDPVDAAGIDDRIADLLTW